MTDWSGVPLEQKIGPCPECGVQVLACDNNVWLEYPSVPLGGGGWTVVLMEDLLLAVHGAKSLSGMEHVLHEHQPAEEKE